MNKYLIVRFSSYGDIAQALPAAQLIRENNPDAEIHWLTRSEFYDFVKSCTAIDRVWALDRKSGLRGLCRLLQLMALERFTHIYDAHNNLRSFLVRNSLRIKNFDLKVIVRSKNRWRRFLLFKLRINKFKSPFRGAYSFLTPLHKWFASTTWPQNFSMNLASETLTAELQAPFALDRAVVLAPSATWDLKKWPIKYWQDLIRLLPQNQFIVVGGPTDAICEDIAAIDHTRVVNSAGRLNWLQSAQLVSRALAVISGDTGILHVADILNKKSVALIGPTAFGFPSRPSTLVAEVPLSCRPCTKDGRGTCRNKEYQKCMRDITPQYVAQLFQQAVKTS